MKIFYNTFCFVLFLSVTNCSKKLSNPNDTSTVVTNQKIQAGVSNLVVQKEKPTVVCNSGAANIKIALTSKLPNGGIRIDYTLTPTLETGDAKIIGMLDFTTGTTTSIDLTGKIRAGEVYVATLNLTAKNDPNNTLVLTNFKVVWE